MLQTLANGIRSVALSALKLPAAIGIRMTGAQALGSITSKALNLGYNVGTDLAGGAFGAVSAFMQKDVQNIVGGLNKYGGAVFPQKGLGIKKGIKGGKSDGYDVNVHNKM